MANGFGSDEPSTTTPAEALLAHRAAALDVAFGKADVPARVSGIVAEANGRGVRRRPSRAPGMIAIPPAYARISRFRPSDRVVAAADTCAASTPW